MQHDSSMPLTRREWQTQKETSRNKGPHTIKFQLSALNSVSPCCANLGGADDNVLSSVLVSHKPLTRVLVQRYYKCLGAYSIPQQG